MILGFLEQHLESSDQHSKMLKGAFVFVYFFHHVFCLPGGAPSLACSSMTPYHFAFQPQPLSESPFSARQSKLKYQPGNDTVTVALTADKGKQFKGFLVKAFNPITNRPIGKFRNDVGVGARDNCHAGTHVNAEEKSFAIVHWSAEDVDENDNFVVFEVTFVESFRKFYVGVESTFRGEPARKAIEDLKKEGKQKLNDLDEDEVDDHTKPPLIRKSAFWF